ncbi:transposable element Tc3 transposase [Trichonephila clavipes]|nr:transposable element Tc3 transposase [Trichonephila clavipes]
MFSDESRFSLQSDSRRTLIWRVSGTHGHQENTIEQYRYGDAGWLVWGGFILGSRTHLHVQSVTMTGHIYRDVILEQHVRLFPCAIGAEFLFMDDNSRPHRANIVDECLLLADIPLKLTVAIYPHERLADIGEVVTFNCSIRGYPVSNVRWAKNAKFLSDGGRLRIIARNQLMVTSVRREDHGLYQCFAGNDRDSAQGIAQLLIGEKLTVWCALWAGGIIGPYFFKIHEGHNVTVNGDRYRAMNTNFFIPELNNHDVQELCFHQDGATCHTARATIDLLKDTFGDRLISRFGPVNWPRRSCDLTPLDYFLWGYVKSLVYAVKPQTLDHLEDNIRRVIADIRPQMLEKVIENWTSRLLYIRASRGNPMPEIIFKM